MKRAKQTFALLLTLLMLVTAVPFTAFGALTPAQESCTHKWNVKDMTAAFLKEEANCQHGSIYYYKCSLCKASAKDVAGAQNKTYDDGQKNAAVHPTDSLVPFGGDENAQPVCKAAGKAPGVKCSACNAVVEPETTVTEVQPHKAAPGKEATCTKKAVCIYCGEEVIPVDPDNHPADKLKTLQEAVEATCTKPGTTAFIQCTDCGATVQRAEVTYKDHAGGTATCTKKAKCTACGQEYGEVNPNNHTLTEHAAVPSNCTDHGTKAYWECTECKKLFSDAQATTVITAPQEEALNPAVHKNLKKISKQDATCSAEGHEEHWFCDGCNKYYSDANAATQIQQSATVITKKPHTWGKMTLVEGSCAAGGKATRTCSVCKTKETVDIVAGKHPAEAQKTTPGKAATCTETGLTDEISCELCGTILQPATTLPALNHDYTGAKATGKGDGTHTFACIRCKAESEPVACTDEDRNCVCDICQQELAHVFTNYQPDGNATCAADGTKTAICDVCGKAKHTVTDEGSKASAQHKYEWTVLDDATCITNAHRKGVCRICEAETLEEIADSAKGHIASDWKYPAGYDCEAGGTRYKECIVCGQQTEIETLSARPHSEVIDPEVKKTCTTDGKSAGSHCDVCGKIITEQIIYTAEGHKANENGFVTTKLPTCTENGIRTATCGVCGQRFDETLPATGHIFEDTVVKPTCTTAGYTLHRCTVCFTENKTNISPATGHDWVETITAATTSKNGKVVLTCKNCPEKESHKVYRIKKIALSQTSFVRDSKSHKPSVIITDTQGNTLKKNTDYTVKYDAGRKKIGTYRVVVTFKGEYAGSKTLKFKIVPTAVKNVKVTAGAKKATLTWSRNSGADVYNIYYATAKGGKYKKLGSTAKLTYTATKLKTGTTYYFKVYAMRKLDSGNYISAASAIRKAKIK